MKKVIIVNGTMGVGKTTTCQILKQKLDNSAFLDGDWCWDMHPYQITDETKIMVQENIGFVLNNFIHCTVYDNIIFCWVMHHQSIIDDILSTLDTDGCEVHVISLVCEEEALVKRLNADVQAGIRSQDVVDRSIKRIPLYADLLTDKIDVTTISPIEAAEQIMLLL